MGFFNLLNPVFDLAATLLQLLLPVWLTMILWAVALAWLCNFLYEWLAPTAALDNISAELKRLRSELIDGDHDFRGLLANIGHTLTLSLRQAGIALLPTLVSAIPFLMLLVWLSDSYTYQPPMPDQTLNAVFYPIEDSAPVERTLLIKANESPDSERFDWVADDIGVQLSISAKKPVNVIHRRRWWNVLIGNPNGFLSDDPAWAEYDKIEFDLTRRELTQLGPLWMRGWEFWLFTPFIIGAIALRVSSSRKRRKASAEAKSTDEADVPFDQQLLGALVCGNRPAFMQLGNLETRWLRRRLDQHPIDRPIYITGLARAGTTILLEIVSRHPDVATHRYSDFPFLFTPCVWNAMLRGLPRQKQMPAERTHKDRIQITSDSPEAMEEMLWMAFFSDAHAIRKSSVKDASTYNAKFEEFYRRHLQKMLMLRKAPRYAAKGNYNITRLEYLLKLFPDARFVLAIRRPEQHLSSLIKQHKLFCRMEQKNPAVLRHLQRAGHFEFGLDVRPINTGDAQVMREILDFWGDPHQSIRGWARYWSVLYRWLHQRLEHNTALRESTMIIRYEDLCAAPAKKMQAMFEHLELPGAEPIIDYFASQISPPDYYQNDFTDEERAIILQETLETARLWDYEE